MPLHFSNAQLLIFRKTGEILIQSNLPRPTISINSTGGGSDFKISELKETCYYLRFDNGKITLLCERNDAINMETFDLNLGEVFNHNGLSFLLTENSQVQDTQSNNASSNSLLFLNELCEWASPSMAGSETVQKSLTSIIDLIIDKTPASSGVLLVEKNGSLTVESKAGVTDKECSDFFKKLPSEVNQQIIDNGVKLLLPEGIKSSRPGEKTIYFDNFRSIAGFPISAEGKLIGILYLGFQNILTELSEETQTLLETVSQILGLVIQRAIFRHELIRLKESPKEITLSKTPKMIGGSSGLMQVYQHIEKLSKVDVSILVLGETGTGKELTASEVHRFSGRANGPFVAVNAAALPDSLVDSELFGHKKGAFTGADSDHIGYIEKADGGVLFIDEIGELSLSVQIKLLRALQEQTIHRVGENTPRKVNFRLVSATNRDLQDMIKKGTFREDLYFRIAGATIYLPPLRQRKSDIIELANHFKKLTCSKHSITEKSWSADAMAALETYTWPGNIRELENTILRACVMSDHDNISAEDLQLSIDGKSIEPIDQATIESLDVAKKRFLKNYLSESLSQFEGNRVKTASALGIGQRTLFRYIEQLGIRSEL